MRRLELNVGCYHPVEDIAGFLKKGKFDYLLRWKGRGENPGICLFIDV